MTISEWLIKTMSGLGSAGVDSPRRDALVLLEDTLEKERSWVLAHPEYELSHTTIDNLAGLIKRRAGREPLAYIRGKAWFYGRFFEVTTDVMIPRPESESFINLLEQILEDKKLKLGHSINIIDVGTGSGCLAITAKLQFPQSEVFAIDVSSKAIEVARRNAKKHDVNIGFLHGSILESLLSSNFHLPTYIIVANLPYVPNDMVTSPEIRREPEQALFSGHDGLDHYRTLWQEIAELAIKPTVVLTEALLEQHPELTILAQASGYVLRRTELLVQQFQPA